MRVMEGQSFERSTDGKWIKLEVELEEADLMHILAEWGAEHPMNLSGRIRPSLAYDILSVQAQILLVVRAHAERVTTREEVQIILQQLTARQAKQKTAVGLAKE